MCSATMAYMYVAYAVCVTIFSTGGEFQLVSNFKKLHALTIAARPYVLLLIMICVCCETVEAKLEML